VRAHLRERRVVTCGACGDRFDALSASDVDEHRECELRLLLAGWWAPAADELEWRWGLRG